MFSNIPNSQKITVMLGVMLALFLAALDQTIVATAMPRIVHELHGLEHLSWVFTAYMLASTVTVPIYGKLSDLYGRKYFILAAVVIFMIGSILSGLSQNMSQLILFRAIQGLGGGGIFANAFAIIGDLFPPRERGKWQGLFGSVFGLASVVGPALGGWLTDNASWRWTFYVNIPVGVLALLVVGLLMPKIVPRMKEKSVDYVGAFLLAGGLTTLLLGLVWGGGQYAWASWQIVGLFFVSLVSFIMFGMVEQRVKEPILPLVLFQNPIFLVSIIIVFLMGVGMFGAILYVPLFAQLVLGISATNSGTILMPLTLGMVVGSIATGQIIARSGKYRLLGIIGIGTSTVGLFMLSQMHAMTSQSDLMIRMILTGAGMGVTFPVFTLAVQNAFDYSKLGVATASVQLFRSIGGTVGTAVLGSVLNSGLSSRLPNIAKDPFIQMAATFNPQFRTSTIDVNVLQGMLTGEGKHMIDAQLSQLSPAIHASAVSVFAQFVARIKDAFAASVAEVFVIATVLMGIAFIVSFFLREIPLRTSHHQRPALEEAGVGIGVEEGEIYSKDEPTIR